MKRLNYFQVHKNKKPKKLKISKPNRLKIQFAILAMQSFSQHAIIVSQEFKSIAEKSIAIVNNVIKHAEAVTNLIKNDKTTTRSKIKRTIAI